MNATNDEVGLRHDDIRATCISFLGIMTDRRTCKHKMSFVCANTKAGGGIIHMPK